MDVSSRHVLYDTTFDDVHGSLPAAERRQGIMACRAGLNFSAQELFFNFLNILSGLPFMLSLATQTQNKKALA